MTLTTDSATTYGLAAIRVRAYADGDVEIDANILGANIVRLRVDAGHTNASAFARHIGVTPQQLKGWEAGRYQKVRLDSLLAIAEGIPCTVEELVVGLYTPHTRTNVKSENKADAMTPPVTPPDVQLGHTQNALGGSIGATGHSVSPASGSSLSFALKLQKHVTGLRSHADALSALANHLVRSAAPRRPTPRPRRTAGGGGDPAHVHQGTPKRGHK